MRGHMDTNMSNRTGKSEFDLARARLDTPGVAALRDRVLHFNNAGAGLMPGPVLDAILGHLRLEAETGGYEAELRAEPAIGHPSDRGAALPGCGRAGIANLGAPPRAGDS